MNRSFRGPAVFGLVMLMAISPAAVALGDTGGQSSADEGEAITAARQLVEQGSIPETLDASLGYHAEVDSGFPVKPTGDCSSPVILPVSFEPACRTHDLGYDLLRLAERSGETIPAGLRDEIDSQFADRISATCEGLECRAVAVAAATAVHLNTLRQRGGAPVAEEWPWSR